MSRGLRVALLLCAAGAVLLLVGAGSRWTTVLVERGAPLPDSSVDVRGSDLVPGLRALGLLGLAGVPALLAVRGWGRTAVGVLLLLGGAAAAVLSGRALADLGARVAASRPVADAAGLPDGGTTYGFFDASPTAWPVLAVAGGALVASGGLLAAARGRSWGGLGSRFDAPQARPQPAAPTEKTAWDALDRGEDPTR